MDGIARGNKNRVNYFFFFFVKGSKNNFKQTILRILEIIYLKIR